MDYFSKELKKVGVNRQTLWEEYKAGNPSPYSYGQFFYHIQQYLRSSKPSMVLDHKPGDKLYVDFAGKLLFYSDRQTGEEIKVQVFVACLPYPDYCFAMAVPSQKMEDSQKPFISYWFRGFYFSPYTPPFYWKFIVFLFTTTVIH